MSAGTALALLAERVSVAPAELQQTLMNTAFKGATEAEFVALIAVANKYDLDPFVREIYAFPKKGGGIVPLVPIDGWLKIIKRHPDYAGMDVRWADEMVKPGNSARQCPEWVEVTIHHKSTPDHPTVHREWIDEMYRDTGPWNTTTKRMLEWKGIIQTGRVAFGLSGIFDQDEAERIGSGEIIDGTAVEEVTGEVIGEAEYTAMLSEVARVGISLSSVAKNVAAKAGYQGELPDMPLKVWESLMAGLAAMPTKNPPTPPSNEPTTATPEAPAGAATPEVVPAAVEPPSEADPAAFWPGEGAPHVDAPESDDAEVPGRGALFSADDPSRPASSTDKRLLSEAIAQLPTAWTKEYRKRFGGRGNSELTHGEIAEFIEAAVKKATA
jgi:phage recombination protein Bet